MSRLLRVVAFLVIGVCAVGVAAPVASRTPKKIAPGVVVAGVRVGGLTSEPARDRLRAAASRSLRFRLGDHRWTTPAASFGAVAAVDDAVARALSAPRRDELDLAVDVDRIAIRSYVRIVAKRYDIAAQDAQLAGLNGLEPVIQEEQEGRAVRRLLLQRLIGRVLRLNVRDRITVPMRPVDPSVRTSDFGSIIVINRGGNELRLYSGSSLVRSFRVATGSAQYPTPSGTFSIVDMQRNPWWRPPDSAWAAGKEAIPPGPGNPLGTRWMGLSAPAVGIHGTPDSASLGYSVSHGCIRMQIPEAEWLFTQVHVGTPVLIV
jgi:lipoprotein-anchoring transpeptidase ErfK/SrfK